MPASKPNGRDLIDFREATSLMASVKEDITRELQRIVFRLDALDVQGPRGLVPLADRVTEIGKDVDELDRTVKSLELSRAEWKGRVAVLAAIVALGVSILTAIIVSQLTQKPATPIPVPTVIVTVQPQAATQTILPQPIILIEPSRGSERPREASTAPRASPSPSMSPTASPSPVGRLCRRLERLGAQCLTAGPDRRWLAMVPLLAGGYVLWRRH